MFVMDILGFSEPSKAHVIVNGLERKWGARANGFKVLRRESAVRVICSKAQVIAEMYTWIIMHPNFGDDCEVHTTKRVDEIFPEMNWGQGHGG